jgi:cell wall-associated NlpC family hydrolase
MSLTREDVVREAREWIGTRFIHQQHSKGLATDCIGHVGGVAVELGVYPRDPHAIPGLVNLLGYGRTPHGDALRKACATFFVEIDPDTMQPGDIVLIAWGNRDPQHVGFLADYRYGGLSIVHALERAGGVVETRFMPSAGMRIAGAFAVPGVS